MKKKISYVSLHTFIIFHCVIHAFIVVIFASKTGIDAPKTRHLYRGKCYSDVIVNTLEGVQSDHYYKIIMVSINRKQKII